MSLKFLTYIQSELGELDSRLTGLAYLFITAKEPDGPRNDIPAAYDGIGTLLLDLSQRTRRLHHLMDDFSFLPQDTEVEFDSDDLDSMGSIEREIKHLRKALRTKEDANE